MGRGDEQRIAACTHPHPPSRPASQLIPSDMRPSFSSALTAPLPRHSQGSGWLMVRPSAEPAAVQADAHGGGSRPLLPGVNMCGGVDNVRMFMVAGAGCYYQGYQVWTSAVDGGSVGRISHFL